MIQGSLREVQGISFEGSWFPLLLHPWAPEFPMDPYYVLRALTFSKRIWTMGPRFEGGVWWCFNGFTRIPNSGPMLGDRRIYFG